jgi:hypothetical protein
VCFDVRHCDTSSTVLFAQYCHGSSWSIVLPDEFSGWVFKSLLWMSLGFFLGTALNMLTRIFRKFKKLNSQNIKNPMKKLANELNKAF